MTDWQLLEEMVQLSSLVSPKPEDQGQHETGTALCTSRASQGLDISGIS